jgi:hypothetical protein
VLQLNPLPPSLVLWSRRLPGPSRHGRQHHAVREGGHASLARAQSGANENGGRRRVAAPGALFGRFPDYLGPPLVVSVILPRFAFAKTESPFRDRGTEGSNPAPSSSESAANPTSVSLRDRDRIRPNAAAADERVGGLRRHVAYGNLHGVAYCGRMLPSQIALPVHRVHLASLTLPIWDETKRDERGSHPPCWPARKPRSPLVPVVLNRLSLLLFGGGGYWGYSLRPYLFHVVYQ